MLDQTSVLEEAIAQHLWELDNAEEPVIGEMYCTGCGGPRRHSGKLFCPTPSHQKQFPRRGTPPNLLCLPTVIALKCTQCDHSAIVVRYPFEQGLRVALLASTLGGLTTPNTPTPVGYYLDQAHKCQCVGANTAALAMYRAALEQLLFHQGFAEGMLAAKISKLEASAKDGTGPSWSRELDGEYLKVIKDLGNGAIHTNGGDISKQDGVDGHLLSIIKLVFTGLLHLVYEVPVQKAMHLHSLKARASVMK